MENRYKYIYNVIRVIQRIIKIVRGDEKVNLIPIQYHKTRYPNDIILGIQEIASNFHSKRVSINLEYSLHTGYSFTNHRFNFQL